MEVFIKMIDSTSSNGLIFEFSIGRSHLIAMNISHPLFVDDIGVSYGNDCESMVVFVALLV